MALNDVLRKGIATAHKLTLPLQSTVQWEAWTGQDGMGAAMFAAPVALKAVLDTTRKQRHVGGRLVTVVASLTFLQPIPANDAAGRLGPIDVRDRITLPDGSTAPILSGPSAVWDDAQSQPFINEVYLGEPETV